VDNKTIRIALIGCGNMGNYYAHNLSLMKDVAIIIACDPSREKLEQFCAKWKIPSGTIDWRELIPREGSSSKIDGIINCSIDKLHGEISNACINSSLPLLAEKPFAVPFETLKNRTPLELKKWLFVINFSKRHIPAIAHVREFLNQGGLGRIHRMELHYRQGWVLNHDFGDWHETSAWFWRLSNDFSHHGVLGDLGSHLFDLACYFCGSVKTISCHLNRIKKNQDKFKGHLLNSIDDAHCLLEMQDGTAVVVNATRTSVGEKDSLSVLISGDKGSIRLMPEESKDSYQLYLVEYGEWQTVACSGTPPKNHEFFIKGIKSSDISDYPGIYEAIYNDVVIEAAVESAQKGWRIDIDSFGEKKLGNIWHNLEQQI
jgi:predicted dehydrogenase